jgi:hypothetical protein
MDYQNGWAWRDDATEEQRESAANEAACDRLAAEARNLYNEIPEIPRRGDDESPECTAEDARWEELVERITDDWADDLTAEQLDEVIQRAGDADKEEQAEKRRGQWGQIEAIEELLSARGGRFCRPYEHWNEDERAMEYAERDRAE